ncbi:conjugal transfer protein [Glutamicibacter soli]
MGSSFVSAAFSKGKRKEKIKPTKEERAPRALGWTHGREILTKSVTWSAMALWVVVPLGTAYVVSAQTKPEQIVMVQPVEASITQAEQQAESVAQGFVMSWLTATKDNTAAIDRYTTLSSTVTLGAQAIQVRSMSVGSNVAGQTDGQRVITVAAETRTDEKQPWMQRYFQVTAQLSDEGAISLVGLPAEVSGAVSSSLAAGPELKNTVTKNAPMGTTVTGFLQAYLAGGKDLERYIAPTFSVNAVAATPYKTAEILSIRTDQEASTSNEKAPDGTVAQAIAQVRLKTGEMSLIADYPLELTSRGGRWEVTNVGTQTASEAVPAPTR